MKLLETLMARAVKDGVFPGAAISIGNATKEIYAQGFGYLDQAQSSAVNLNVIYDVASLTKVMVTGILVMQAVSEGKIELDTLASAYLPLGKASYTLRHLMTHSSGLPAWRAYYKDIPSQASREDAEKIYLDKISAETLTHTPGSHAEYSDLGFILLGILLEKIYNEDLKGIARKKIFSVNGLKKTQFGPVSGSSVAPTEDCPERQKVIRGEVHDLNAWALKGVAGHAGVFSTATDVGLYARLILRNLRGEKVFLEPEMLSKMSEMQNLPPGSTWALAWDTPSVQNSSAGTLWTPRAIGHLGFTGCSIWIDLKREIYAVCLSNRVHPNAKNDKIKAFRPEFHDCVIRCLD